MNIYLIAQDVNDDYDTYDNAVVIADNEEEARIMNPDGDSIWSSERNAWMQVWNNGTQEPSFCKTWANPVEVKVTKIGVAESDKTGVLCASFNAG